MNNLPLEEVANIYSGNSINAKLKKEKYTDKNFSTPYVATKDLSKNGDFEYNNGVTIPDTELDNFKIAPKGSTLICMEGGSAGKKIGLVKQDVCFVNKLGALVPNEKINNRYLYYSLQTPEFQAQFKSSLTGIIGGVSLSKLKKLQIPVPSLQEQKKIVEKLDNFEQIISKLNMNRINKINEYKKFIKSLSLLLPDKDTKVFQIDDITVEYGRGKSKHRPRNFKGLYDGKYPFIQTGDIRNSNIYIKKYKKTYNESGLKQSKLWPAGTICLNIAANVGDVAILTFDACFPDSVLGIKANTEIVDDKYLYYLLFKKFDEINKMSENSAAQKNFNLQKLRALRFNVPSLEVQKDIISKLDSAFKNIKILTNTLDIQDSKINLLSKSVLNKEFSYE